MEDSIATFRKTLGAFCNHLQTSCDALKQSMDRRPIPLDSASSTFVQCLNRRVETATGDLNFLDSMSFGTVSFEELLGHCYEVFNKNQNDLLELEDRLKNIGYVPGEIDDSDEEHLCGPLSLDSEIPKDKLNLPSSIIESAIAANSAISCLEEDPFLDESLSLKKYGLSDACLATLAEANHKIDSPDFSSSEYNEDKGSTLNDKCKPVPLTFEVTEDDPAQRPVIVVSKDDYESLPSYMTGLTSWEDLLTAVEKINSSLNKKAKTKGYSYFLQDEIASLDLGPKSRVYLLLLTRMNRLVVETIDGLISYRVL
ncbi:hypothetical protein SLE2022_064080 [Rubroshorea leprosula]